MNDITVAQRTDVAKFDPKHTKKIDAQADAVIEYAKRMKDWPLLERAVDTKIEEQIEFVRWWRDTVTPRQSPGRKGAKSISDQKLILSADRAQELTEISPLIVHKWSRRIKDVPKYRLQLIAVTRKKAMEEAINTTAIKWDGNQESYTPKEYIQSAYDVMGTIDVDPASNPFAQGTVKAGTYYSLEDNGLAHEWRGTVFLNPPYSHPEISHFIEKLCEEFEAGRTTEAILLTNNNTDTKWWHRAATVSAAVCFTAGRINFYQEDGKITQPTNGQNFFYFGAGVSTFADVFKRHGFVMVKHAETP